MANWPIAVLAFVVVVLLTTRVSMATACAMAALLALSFAGLDGQELIATAAPNAVLVLVVMTAVQVAVGFILEAGAAQRVSLWIARATASRLLRRVPATVLLPLIFIPTAMIIAAALHNITAILLCAPIAIAVSKAYGVKPTVMLSAMLIASNLGGASMAFGDTPAIIQRSYWGFSCATFAAAMLPRNLLILFLLTALSCVLTWFPSRANGTKPREILERLRRRDSEEAQAAYRPIEWRAMGTGLLSLSVFLALQFCFPAHSLVVGSALLAVLLLARPEDKRIDALVVLGLEAVLVIVSIFILAAAVDRTPAVELLTAYLRDHNGNGLIEVLAFALTSGISADGAAATLAPIIHGADSSMGSAWALASGICAGSSALLTAASAGPVLNAVSKVAGSELSFRDYAKTGIPFALLMLGMYVLYNTLIGG